MTASLPKPREEALRRTIQDVHGLNLEPIPGPTELEELPRYHKLAAPGNDPLPLIQSEIERGGKVLWVRNTVGRVMDAADKAKDLGPLVYHSRYRYEDRVQQHKRVVRAFTPEHHGPALAICSQVAEMSLDLKGCTLLVTDLAPVPSLIQRAGPPESPGRTGRPNAAVRRPGNCHRRARLALALHRGRPGGGPRVARSAPGIWHQPVAPCRPLGAIVGQPA